MKMDELSGIFRNICVKNIPHILYCNPEVFSEALKRYTSKATTYSDNFHDKNAVNSDGCATEKPNSEFGFKLNEEQNLPSNNLCDAIWSHVTSGVHEIASASDKAIILQVR